MSFELGLCHSRLWEGRLLQVPAQRPLSPQDKWSSNASEQRGLCFCRVSCCFCFILAELKRSIHSCLPRCSAALPEPWGVGSVGKAAASQPGLALLPRAARGLCQLPARAPGRSANPGAVPGHSCSRLAVPQGGQRDTRAGRQREAGGALGLTKAGTFDVEIRVCLPEGYLADQEEQETQESGLRFAYTVVETTARSFNFGIRIHLLLPLFSHMKSMKYLSDYLIQSHILHSTAAKVNHRQELVNIMVNLQQSLDEANQM
ncbi:hypothetical protein EK904_004264 [Melospiza melodia maxima]|nr:hypothetical protein EK904_004264 [Melospiza melodia maxima]